MSEDYTERRDGERRLTQDQVDLADKARELAGSSMKITRFIDEDRDPRLRDKKRREAEIKRVLSELQRRMLDEDYRIAFTAADTALRETRQKLDDALIEISDILEALEDAAPKTKDGKAVFLLSDGRGRTKDGEVISAADMASLITSNRHPTWSEYEVAQRRFLKLTNYVDEVENTHKRLHNDDKPLDKPDVEDIAKRMQVIERTIEDRPSLAPAFNPVAMPLDTPPLDLTAAPTLPAR